MACSSPSVSSSEPAYWSASPYWSVPPCWCWSASGSVYRECRSRPGTRRSGTRHHGNTRRMAGTWERRDRTRSNAPNPHSRPPRRPGPPGSNTARCRCKPRCSNHRPCRPDPPARNRIRPGCTRQNNMSRHNKPIARPHSIRNRTAHCHPDSSNPAHTESGFRGRWAVAALASDAAALRWEPVHAAPRPPPPRHPTQAIL